MADIVTTKAKLEGNWKEVYGNGIPNLVPNEVVLQKEVKFSEQDKLGNKYNQPVRLTLPNGFTYAASGAGAFALNDAKAGLSKNAEINGSQVLLRDMMDYETAHLATASQKAFKAGTAFMIEGMQESVKKRLEISLMYGSSGLGVVSAIADGVITLTPASFAPGIWSGLESAELDVYNGDTKINTNAAVVVESVDLDAKTVTVSGNATDLSAIAATHTIYFKGSKGNEMLGLHGILTTANKFGIDGGLYSLWNATSHSAADGALTFAKAKKAIVKGISKGMSGGICLLVNPGAWDDIHDNLQSLRRTEKSEVSKLVVGADEIEFAIMGIRTKIKSSIFVKQSYAYGLSLQNWKRVGATDVSFEDPMMGGQIFLQMQSNAGFEVRAYSHQALFCKAPAKNFIITNIVNGT